MQLCTLSQCGSFDVVLQGGYGSDTFNDVRNLNDTITSIELNAAFTGALAGTDISAVSSRHQPYLVMPIGRLRLVTP